MLQGIDIKRHHGDTISHLESHINAQLNGGMDVREIRAGSDVLKWEMCKDVYMQAINLSTEFLSHFENGRRYLVFWHQKADIVIKILVANKERISVASGTNFDKKK